MKRVAFVTNIAADIFSGGFSAMNKAMFDVLCKTYIVDYIGPISPKPSVRQHFISKVRRVFGLEGAFFFFSEQRLEAIRREVKTRLTISKAEFAVFHGFTPWINTCPNLPYVAWNDCTFWQYVQINCDVRRFRKSDLERIKMKEAAWLRNARRVIFRSAWAASESIRDYRLDKSRVAVVGNYGFATPPTQDCYEGGREFLFIATDFRKKGGDVAVAAFRQAHASHPEARLVIVGENPGKEVLDEPGVQYLGSIDKSDTMQKDLLDRKFATACCLLHPTTADTNPMVLIEAGYFGCPAISTRRYAIPELVVDGVSGLLLDDPTDVAQLAKYMERMLRWDELYRLMRKEARCHMLGYYTREAFHQRLCSEIEGAMEV